MDPDLWHPSAGQTVAREALDTCDRCPVRQDCLEWALENRERYGIWGGLSERARRRLLRARNGAHPEMARAPRPKRRAG